AHTLSEAKRAISSSKSFDVVILDLGWNGDPGPDWSDIAGWDLVKSMPTTEAGDRVPIIMYSYKFDTTESLARTAAELGALPLPKTYTEGSHQTLLCAVRFLAMRALSRSEQLYSLFSDSQRAYKQRERELRLAALLCLVLIGVVGLVLISSAVALAFGRTNQAIFGAIASVLVGTLLTFASNHARSAAQRSEAAMKEARENLASEKPAQAA